MPCATFLRRLSVLVAGGALASGGAAEAGPQFTILHSFLGPPGDGSVPLAGVVLGPQGVLYGATSQGGAYGTCGLSYCGTVYQLVPPAQRGGGWTESVIYNFTGQNDGALPKSDLAIDGTGTLYGTAYKAGLHSSGTAFALAPPMGGDWTLDVLYPFGSSDHDGLFPVAGLIAGPAGSYYGTTERGGVAGVNNTQMGYGTVYQLVPPISQGNPWTHVKLYTFRTCCTTPQGNQPAPGVLLNLPDGSLLDATCCGGSVNGGVAYDLVPPVGGNGAWKEMVVHNFVPIGSKGPNGALIGDGNGNYYGTSSGEGAYAGQPCHGTCGVVYELTQPNGAPAPWTYKVLYSFKGDTDGAVPRAGLVLGPGGVLYGTTFVGGDTGGSCFNVACGTIFQLTPPVQGGTHWSEKVLHRFHGADGENPLGRLVIDGNGVLYGTASEGGSAGFGTVFALVP